PGALHRRDDREDARDAHPRQAQAPRPRPGGRVRLPDRDPRARLAAPPPRPGMIGRMAELRALALDDWEPTKDTLHLWVQIVGKIRLATAPPQSHWWNATLYVDACGVTTRRIRASGRDVELAFDFVGHR